MHQQTSLDFSGIRDNRHRGTLADFLREKLGNGDRLAVVSAYFTIHAFSALKDYLEDLEQVDFLFGEPRFIKSLGVETQWQDFMIREEGLGLRDTLKQDKIAKACEQWIQEKVNIRSIRQANLLHGKLYHITKLGREDAILGSSNFTLRGLGLAENQNNIELNLIVDSDRDRRDLKNWFYEIWDDANLVEDVKEEVIGYLKQVYRDNPPEFIYYKTLYHIFQDYLARKEEEETLRQQIKFYDTKIWNTLYQFQRQGVISIINKIRQYNGCILADSVGLGKTFEALAVIKYFELRNEKVLVLCPKKLRQNWEIYQVSNNSELNFLEEDKFNFTVLSHTDLSRDQGMSGNVNLADFKWGNFDLVVIDESHNFRNNTKGKRDEEGQVIRKSRYERLMEDIITNGVNTKVLLLSATPVNTDLTDLRNQIYLITQNNDRALQNSLMIHSIQSVLKTAQQEFTNWSRLENHQVSELYDRLSSAFFSLLDGLTLARSRDHIKRYYQQSLEELGGFPQRSKPISVHTEIDTKDNFPDYDHIYQQVSEYQLSLFNPSKYVLPQYHEHYAARGVQNNFSQEDREFYLIGMMKVNFLKRLESSICSFRITLERTIEKIKKLEDKLHQFQQERTGKIDSNDLQVEAGDDEELTEAWTVGKNAVFEVKHLDVARWLKDLGRDRRQLYTLFLQAQDVTGERDGKLQRLKGLIAEKVKNPTQNLEGQANRKVLVFTAFADTAKYLYEQLQPWVSQELQIHSALVTGSNGNQCTWGKPQFEQILTHFSPRSKQRNLMGSLSQTVEIDLLIATDCISEGQNLQDCDYLINYDIHWNPVRIIQRFGRIDRLGSINKTVQLVNFWPVEDLNRYINLKNRVEARMALVDITATGEDNVLAIADQEAQVREEMTYRDQQLLRLQNEVLDLEDFEQTVSLTDFSLDDFRMDLLNYLNQNQEALANAPMGIYGVVPAPPSHPQIQPGLIFCLRQRGEEQERVKEEAVKRVNPLQPYFLVYVLTNGTVRYTFTQPKSILQIFQDLCASQTKPYEDLCRLFDRRTENGVNMAVENDLLLKAVQSITETFGKRALSNLFNSGKRGLLPAKAAQVSQVSDFELVTWLVIAE